MQKIIVRFAEIGIRLFYPQKIERIVDVLFPAGQHSGEGVDQEVRVTFEPNKNRYLLQLSSKKDTQQVEIADMADFRAICRKPMDD